MSVERDTGDGADRLIGKLTEIVERRLEADKLIVPCWPSAAANLTRLVRDAEATPQKAVEAIGRDPLVAAQVLRLAASTGPPVTSIEEAVTRLELSRLKQPLGEMAARQMSESQSSGITEASRAVWRHAIGTALLARDLAALAQSPAGDEAYTAGLVHDIGEPVIAAMLLEAERQLARGRSVGWIGAAQWTAAVKRAHRDIGQKLAERWALPASARRLSRDCAEYEAADRSSPLNFVIFANAIAKRVGLYHGPFDADDAAALEVIGRSLLGLQEGVVNALCGGILERVDALLA